MPGPLPFIIGGAVLLIGAAYRSGEGERLANAIEAGDTSAIERAYAYARRHGDIDLMQAVGCLVLGSGCGRARYVLKGSLGAIDWMTRDYDIYGRVRGWNPDHLMDAPVTHIPGSSDSIYLQWDSHIQDSGTGIPLRWDVSTQRLFLADCIEHFEPIWRAALEGTELSIVITEAIEGARAWVSQEIPYEALSDMNDDVRHAEHDLYSEPVPGPLMNRTIGYAALRAAWWVTDDLGPRDDQRLSRDLALKGVKNLLEMVEREAQGMDNLVPNPETLPASIEARAWIVGRSHAYLCGLASGTIIDPRVKGWGGAMEGAARGALNAEELSLASPQARFDLLLARLKVSNGRRRKRIVKKAQLVDLIKRVAALPDNQPYENHEMLMPEEAKAFVRRDVETTVALAVRTPTEVVVDVTSYIIPRNMNPTHSVKLAWPRLDGDHEYSELSSLVELEGIAQYWAAGPFRIRLPLDYARTL